MPKTLNILFPEKCIGCELCVIECQKQLGKIGLDGALIRVLKSRDFKNNQIKFAIEIDPKVNDMDIKKISHICPAGVFSIEEKEPSNELVG